MVHKKKLELDNLIVPSSLVSGYKSNKFNCLDCTSIEFL